MKLQHMKLKVFVLAAGAVSTAAVLASEPVMVSRFARDTGLSPAEVVLTLGDNYHVVEAQYNARPSTRGHLARLTLEAHDRRMAARLPPARSGDILATLPPLDQ